MEINHLLYKVNDLDKSVAYFRKKGFTVEYGKEKNPTNALIYFPQGPYIELISSMNMPKILQIVLKCFGKKEFVAGMLDQENAEEGFIRACIGCDTEEELQVAEEIYKKYGKKTMHITVKRNDTKGRKLCCKTIFPYDANLPFVKTPFKQENELHNITHLNGAKRIDSFVYGLTKDNIKLVRELDSSIVFEALQATTIKNVKICTNNGIEQIQ